MYRTIASLPKALSNVRNPIDKSGCGFRRKRASKQAVAAVGLMPTPKVVHVDGHDYHIVIIPTAPVPFGGALLCIPVERVTPAPCTVEGMINIFMSMGASAPEYLGSTGDRRGPEA